MRKEIHEPYRQVLQGPGFVLRQDGTNELSDKAVSGRRQPFLRIPASAAGTVTAAGDAGDAVEKADVWPSVSLA